MTRHNDFSRKTKAEARARATRDGVLYCEGVEGVPCGLPIKVCRGRS